jgi:hypothetical protein
MSDKFEHLLQTSFSVVSVGSKRIDSVAGWTKIMYNRYVLVDKRLYKQNKKSWTNFAVAFFLCLSTLKFIDNCFVDLNAPYELKMYHGALFHSLGFAGKVLLIVATSAILQSAFYRLLFWHREKKNRLEFLEDFVNFEASDIITEEVKESFFSQLRMYYVISTRAGYASCGSSVTLTIVIAMFSAYPNLTITNCIIWGAWTFPQIILAWFVVPDIMILGSFWFILRTHVLLLTKQVLSELNVFRNTCQSKQLKQKNDASINKHFKMWHFRYMTVKRVLHDFDVFSQTFLFIANSTSSIMSAAFLFAMLKSDEIFIKLLLTPGLISITATVMLLLFSATSISSMGKRLYKTLNHTTVTLQQELTRENRIALKYLIQDTGNQRCPGVSLKMISGVVCHSLSFAEFVVSFITLFLMMFDLLHQVL